MILKKEKISFYTHFIAALCAIIGTVFLFTKTTNHPNSTTISLIYGISASLVFIASSAYHARKKIENDVSVWRKLDHFAIFVMIAGTYTPICLVYLKGTMCYAILIAQWTLVAFGAIFKFAFLKSPRILSTLIYLAMGWMAIIAFKGLLSNMPTSQLLFVLGGGIAYSIGAVLYALKKPVLVQNFFGFHEIFHILIIVGAALHYTMVFRSL